MGSICACASVTPSQSGNPQHTAKSQRRKRTRRSGVRRVRDEKEGRLEREKRRKIGSRVKFIKFVHNFTWLVAEGGGR